MQDTYFAVPSILDNSWPCASIDTKQARIDGELIYHYHTFQRSENSKITGGPMGLNYIVKHIQVVLLIRKRQIPRDISRIETNYTI